jgi:glycosyltransferase involved in cell wall biosynthesis
MRHPRVVVLTSIMAPHRIASFNALASDPDLDVDFVYLARTDPSRAWETHEHEMRFRHRVLHERWAIRRGPSYLHLTTGLFGALRELRPDVLVVGGWDQAAYLEAYGLRDLLGCRFLWWIESNLRDRRPSGSSIRRLKRGLIAGVDGVVVPGTASRQYARALGAPDDSIWSAPNAVDNARYRAREVDRASRHATPQMLFVGRLESEKGLLTLLDAWSAIDVPGELTIVGSGSLRDRVAERVATATMPPVRLVGHQQRDDLVDRYAEADAFVFPSVSDPWGLVLNEAMAAGLPVVASSAAGAVADLVEHGRNGLVVVPWDAGALATALSSLLAEPSERLKMGRESAAIIERFTPEAWAAGMRRAVLGVLERAV